MAAGAPWRAVALAALLAIAAAAGYYYLAQQQAAESAESHIYYVVPVAWGFAVFNEDFERVDRIVVERGDLVTIVLLPEPFVPESLHEEIEEYFAERAAEMGVSPEELKELHEQAEEELGSEAFGVRYLPHGLAIEGYEDLVNLDASKGVPVAVTFVADRPGSFDIYCSVFCGWGHGLMRLDDAFVVKG